ncbi:hypothetical protein HCU40_11520 [Pseudanabaena biceps]|nr:hypothetical protein [Pseudanabaena biceps]
MTKDEFDIEEAEMLRDVQIEDESGCDIRAGINHGANLGNYLFEKIKKEIQHTNELVIPN